MTTARPARTILRAAAALLLGGSLGACGAEAGAGAGDEAPPDLGTALALDVKGFAAADAPEPPATVCRDENYNDDPVPVLPGSLGEPTAVGYSSEDAELHAWAWRTPTPEAATTVVDQAVADLAGCSFQIHFDSDTDGDGELDAGGSEEQTARPWSDEFWTGMSASARFYGGGAELVESRFARNGDVVVLVVLTVHGNGDGLLPTVEAYLDGVAVRLR
jgi:hypothetical protein